MAGLSMENFIDSVCNENRLRVEDDLGDGFVRLRSDEAERRQAAHDIRSVEDIVIELLRNSRDAHAKNIFLSVSKEGTQRSITVIDDGDGIPAHLHELVFEPRVTSKLDSIHMDKWGVHGRGMALFSIKMNTLSSEVVCSYPGFGCAIGVVADTESVSERTDQSSFPRLMMSDTGALSFRGPRNILRTACEFALEHRESISVFIGSPAEIVAALYKHGLSGTTSSQRAFGSTDAVSVPLRAGFALSDNDLSRIAKDMGLRISARTARRILEGEIAPADNLLHRIATESFPNKDASRNKGKAKHSEGGKRGVSASVSNLQISSEDREAFLNAIGSSFGELAERYYLDGDVAAKMTVEKNAIRISIPIVPLS